jgi:nucleotide-binding universal stress UspA family protein
MIKDIVVNLSVAPSRDVAGAYAISLAESVGAHLAAVAFSYEPIIPPTILGGVPASFIDEQRAQSDRDAKTAIVAFDAAARRAGLSSESRSLSASVAGGADMFGRIARRFDLSVVGQAEPDKVAPEELIVEGALFASGRPVLVVPYIQKGPFTAERAMIAWDGSRSAARAVADAMPLLTTAKAVDVVIVADDKGKGDELPGADIAQHLARHGLKVDVKRIVAGDSDVASTLLSHAADTSADLIVMGAYGHSRLREFILGGVTRGILSAMTVPTLMSH